MGPRAGLDAMVKVQDLLLQGIESQLCSPSLYRLGVGIAQSCSDGPQTGRSVYSSRQCKVFSLVHSVQTGSGAQPVSHPTVTGGSLFVGKVTGA
jgi:hypothetical protein